MPLTFHLQIVRFFVYPTVYIFYVVISVRIICRVHPVVSHRSLNIYLGILACLPKPGSWLVRWLIWPRQEPSRLPRSCVACSFLVLASSAASIVAFAAVCICLNVKLFGFIASLIVLSPRIANVFRSKSVQSSHLPRSLGLILSLFNSSFGS